MNKRLDIIVIHHNEPIFFIDRFFISLKNQSFKDYDITIVVNKDDNFDYKRHIKNVFIRDNSINVNVVKCDKTTQSAKRNLGIESSNNPYIMLCDCDDSFICDDSDGLKNVVNNINSKTIEYVSYILAEVYENSHGEFATLGQQNNDKLVFRKCKQINASTIHGKIFRRKEIEEYDVKFDEELNINEESCFSVVMKFIAEKLNGLNTHNEPFYVYRRNANSTVHKCSLYPIQGLDQFITSAFKSEMKKEEFLYKLYGGVSREMRNHLMKNWYNSIMICITTTMSYLMKFTESEQLDEILYRNSSVIKSLIKEFKYNFSITDTEEDFTVESIIKDFTVLKGISKSIITEQFTEFNSRFLENNISYKTK